VAQACLRACSPLAYAFADRSRVATPLLERAFSEIYGIEMKDLFFSEDLAIGTYRHAVAITKPDDVRCSGIESD